MSRLNRRTAVIALSIAVTAFFAVRAVRHVPFGPFLSLIERARWRWVFLMVLLCVLDLVIRAARWKFLLKFAAPKAAPAALFKLEAIGLAINNLLFLRIGELARAFLAAQELEIPLGAGLSSIAIERALDTAVLLALFLAASHFRPGIASMAVIKLVRLALILIVAALAVLTFAESKLLSQGTVIGKLLSKRPTMKKMVEGLIAGAAALKEPGPALFSALLSFALWSADALIYFFGARALGFHIGYAASVLVLGWAGAASALPAVPGGLGTFEAFVESILGQLGAAPQAALAFALLTHVVMYGVVTFLGIIFISKIGLSLSDIGARALSLKKSGWGDDNG